MSEGRSMEPENPYASPQTEAGATPAPRLVPELDWKTLKQLRNNSHTIRALGALSILAALSGPMWAFTFLDNGSPAMVAGVCVAFLALFGLVTYSCWWRPRWGRVPGTLYCLLLLLSIPIGTIIGIFGLVAYAGGRDLFGPNRYLHRILQEEWKFRKRSGAF